MYERLFQLQEETLKTLANQKRLEIVQLLGNKELTVSEMVDMLGLPQSNLSQHLSVLRHARLVSTRKDGLRVYYRLTDERIIDIVRELRAFLKNQYRHEPDIAQINVFDEGVYPIVRDPVCGMRLAVSEAAGYIVETDTTHYFCASGCRDRFLESMDYSAAGKRNQQKGVMV